MPMNEDFAKYIEDLHFCAANTHRAEDRELYSKYLAASAYILAELVLGANKNRVLELIKDHERLWGNTWLQDPIYERASKSYNAFKAKYVIGI